MDIAVGFGLTMAAMEIKHYVADFLLQTDYHLGKFKKQGWVKPLAHHCTIHALGTLAIVSVVRPEMCWLALVDFVVHFTMDRIKASPDLLGRFKSLSGDQYLADVQLIESSNKPRVHPETRQKAKYAMKRLRSNKIFWWCLGLDQLVHQLTGLGIVVCTLCK